MCDPAQQVSTLWLDQTGSRSHCLLCSHSWALVLWPAWELSRPKPLSRQTHVRHEFMLSLQAVSDTARIKPM